MIDADTISRAIHIAQLLGFLLADFILLYIAWKVTHTSGFVAIELIATKRDNEYHPDQHKISYYTLLITGFTVIHIFAYKNNPATNATDMMILYSGISGWFIGAGMFGASLKAKRGTTTTTDVDGSKTTQTP